MNRNGQQKGLSEVDLIVLLIFLILIALIVLPHYLSSELSTAEQGAAANLRVIHQAQQKYFGMTATGYYGDFIDLVQTGKVLPPNWAQRKVTVKTYTFTLTRNDSFKRYCVTAQSEATGEKDLGINTDGVVYEAKKGQMTCAEGELAGSGLTVVNLK